MCKPKNQGKFIVGDEPTLADLQIFFECTDKSFWGSKMDEYPYITKWMDKMLAIPEIKAIQDEFDAYLAMLAAKAHQ
jgi:glutathione S-transferase